MKKIICIVLSLVMAACLVTGCSGQKAEDKKEKNLSIVTTVFPEYDWVREIMGSEADNADITMLLDNGVDLHSYQPTADDIVKISDCDIFIYVGGESDEWVEDALKNTENKDIRSICLMDVLGEDVKEEEIVEGMEHEHEEGEEHEHEEEEPEYDEHVWLSLKNAKVLCKAIAQALEEADPANRENYSSNLEAYEQKLSDLDTEYQQTVDSAARKTLLFGDRFPFRYLADDYGIDYYAAFAGCSSETEASFETVSFLAAKTDELKLPYIMTIEGNNKEIAETIISNTSEKNQKILSMDSMQSTTSEDIKNGATYISIMKSNLDVLEKALN